MLSHLEAMQTTGPPASQLSRVVVNTNTIQIERPGKSGGYYPFAQKQYLEPLKDFFG